MTGEWAIALILIAVAITVSAILIAVLAARRRSTAADDHTTRLDAARRATRQLARDKQRRSRGTIRGKGMGTNDIGTTEAQADTSPP